MKPRILIVYTGGTIGMIEDAATKALRPFDFSHLMENVPKVKKLDYVIDNIQFQTPIDSSDMDITHWQSIVRSIADNYDNYDGFVVLHGTDTMAYTASAVTWMLPGIDRPVVFTGSQVPLAEALSDGPDNLSTAFAMAAQGYAGVYLAFDRRVMLGCRAVKVRASGFNAFESVNARYAAQVSNRGLVIDKEALQPQRGPAQLRPEISCDVFLLKLTPGLSPEIFEHLADMGYRGIVIEAFGLGGVNVLHEGLRGIRAALARGVSIVVTTQCLYDASDLGVYQVGRQLLSLGVIQGRDMTSEAAMTKLMWALGQGMAAGHICELFSRNLAGEITVKDERNGQMR